jgi:ATP-dependent helicase/nuclease subunit B
MAPRTLYCGPRLPTLETTAFAALADDVDARPDGLLYLARDRATEPQVRERWRGHGRPHSLTVRTFDDLVADCYETARYAGRVTHVDQPLRDRLVELAVEALGDPDNPLTTPTGLPAPGLCDQVEDLLSLLEFADLQSPAAIRERLAAEGLPVQAATATAVASAFEHARATVLDDVPAETFRAERYHAVVEETDLAASVPSVDAVVLGGFTLFSPLERALVKRVAETWPTVALLPQVTDDPDAVGVDRGAERALTAYRRLGFEREYVPADGPGVATARRLYRSANAALGAPDATGTAPPDADSDLDPDPDLALVQPATPPAELRYVARDLRKRIAADTEPNDVAVVLPSPGASHDRLVETLDRYGVPATLAVERALGDTAVGEVLAELARLGRADPPLEAATTLLSNPLVTGLDCDRLAVSRVASRLSSRRLATASDHLPDATATELQSVVDEARALREVSLAELPTAVGDLLDSLGVTAAVDALPRTLRGRTERRATKRVERVLETLALTAGHADLDRGDPVERLERALSGVTLETTGGREEGHVRVCGLDDVAAQDVTHAYLLGLTTGQFPSTPERLAYFRPINEAHEDFEQADVQQRARYHVGLLLASDASLTLSVPRRDLEGDPLVEADVVTELRRVTGLDPEPVGLDDVPPGTSTDVQRSLARTVAHDGTDDPAAVVDRAADSGAFDGGPAARLRAGTACAAARASPQLTPYDGQLSAETVAALHGPAVREPYSPSRLETYATCGFRYYASRVLGMEEPEEIGLEPDARARGGFVHAVLERYYAGLQSAPGEPVEPVGDRGARETHLLDVALSCLDERFDDDPTAFQRRWLVAVLAGLNGPADNPYHGGDRFGTPERGLLVRFLDHEFGEVSKATARPAWLEARVGNRWGDGSPLREDPVVVSTPAGPVPLHGIVDRIDAVPATDPTRLVVRDYKTGGTPSEADTLGGVALQLPLYALLAEGALDDVETVGGAYYQVRPPTGVSGRKGLLGSQEHASYYDRDADEIDTPLLRYGHPTFETHAAFRRFVEVETPARLGQLDEALSAGRFQPTLLDADAAGCRHCGYRDVCDVRHHRRRDVLAAVDAGEVAGSKAADPSDREPADDDEGGDGTLPYVPLAARPGDPADVLEVE